MVRLENDPVMFRRMIDAYSGKDFTNDDKFYDWFMKRPYNYEWDSDDKYGGPMYFNPQSRYAVCRQNMKRLLKIPYNRYFIARIVKYMHEYGFPGSPTVAKLLCEGFVAKYNKVMRWRRLYNSMYELERMKRKMHPKGDFMTMRIARDFDENLSETLQKLVENSTEMDENLEETCEEVEDVVSVADVLRWGSCDLSTEEDV